MSRITSKYQATVPADVRAALGVKAGDRLAWQIEADGAKVRGVPEPNVEEVYTGAVNVDSKVFGEWLSDEDEEAFRDL